MVYLLVRHQVRNYPTWKAAYDSHLPSRRKAGLTERHLLRGVDNPNEVVLLFEAEDVGKAKAFVASTDLREAMERAGVVDIPAIHFLSSAK